jgi:hypothetical protein
MRAWWLCGLFSSVIGLIGCGAPVVETERMYMPPAATTIPAADASGTAVLLAAGYIANCDTVEDEATAKLLDQLDGTIATLGDNAYNDGTAEQFAACYEPTWGRHKARTRPALGNHDHHMPAAAGYFTYFGAHAGDAPHGYYSYNLGAWHIVVLNSECVTNNTCGPGSPQEQWLRADLAAHPARCTLAYWHHPRFSSGRLGNNPRVDPFWQALYDAGADVVLNGHDHDYERFAPQDPRGTRDDVRGIRAFVVGTGGTKLRPFTTIQPNSEARSAEAHGVLKLTLHAESYDWEFVPIAGQQYRDSGTAPCSPYMPTPSPSAQNVTAYNLTD